MGETIIDKLIDENKNINKHILILYLIIFPISILFFTNLYYILFGIFYFFALYYFLKNTKFNMIKILYLLIFILPILNIFNNILFKYFVYVFFSFILFYFFGNFVAENKLSINRKQIIILTISLIYVLFITSYNIMNIYSLFFISLLGFLFNLDDKKIYHLTSLNFLDKNKQIIFSIISLFLSIQLILSLIVQNILILFTISLFTILEFILMLMIKRIFNNKPEGFTAYILILIIFLFIFFTILFFLTKNNIIYIIQNIIIMFLFFFTAIHAYLFHRFPDSKKIILGIVSGIPFILMNLANYFYYINPGTIFNFPLFIILFSINLLILAIIGLVLIYIHLIYKKHI
ncbi:putative membrane protein [Candidatus Nanobsidianus stetteri]|uniref:Putative membrane protein n=1 Tax=Nanobsidianus stetteri TaxID=1294122 RepID=R1G8R7_NANST|nr:putative membrane protein [Candidatus Nanobsidianus stetteri]